MKRFLKFAFCFCVLAIISGCSAITHEYTPTIYALEDTRITTVTSDELESVAIINAQDDQTRFFLGEIGRHKYWGNLNQLTQTMVQTCETELLQRGIRAQDGADKSLSFSVDAATLDRGMWVVRGVWDVTVTTGSGLTKQYHVENPTPNTVPRAHNGAAALAIIDILQDPEIIAYLKGD
ncbi:MAG: hypothetical protein OEV34_16060 [Gammaproteobacteria bacterium]|nr:hypothetical protein [Gammaproteobacteria bacterium]MDH3990648.1 hypothetical protein [Gammaproteobacteria bacterium]